MLLPKVKTRDIVVQQLPNEVLIYNKAANKAYSLNETAAQVYGYCQNGGSFSDLKDKHQLNDEIILLALDGLKKEELLEESYVSPVNHQSRREIIKKAGLMTAAALPVIYSLVAPTASGAASFLAPNSFCANPAECTSNACVAEVFVTPPTTFPGPTITTPGPPIVIPGIFGNPPTTFPGTPIISVGPPVTLPGTSFPTGRFICQ